VKIVTITDATGSGGQVTNGVKVGRALARLGHTVSRISHKQIDKDHLRGAGLVLAFGTVVRADYIMCRKPVTMRGRDLQGGYFKRIRDLKDKDAVSALWYFDQCNPRQKHSPYKFAAIQHACRDLDWLITTDHSFPWETKARNYLWLMQGVDPAEFDYTVLPPEPRAYDIVYTGGVDGHFGYRKKLINDLKVRFKVSAYGRGHARRVFGRDFFTVYQRARVGLVPHPLPEARDHYWSNRIYIATATGTPCLVGYVPGVEDHFTDGKEVMFYRTTQEASQKAYQLVNDPDMRREMGRVARERTLREHTYDARCRTMLDAIFKGTTH